MKVNDQQWTLFVENLKTSLREQLQIVEPGDDPPPCSFMLLDPEKHEWQDSTTPAIGIVVFAEQPGVMNTDRGKDAMAAAIKNVLDDEQPLAAAHMAMAWASFLDDEMRRRVREFVDKHGRVPETYNELGVPPPREDPHRVEVMSLVAVGNDGRVLALTARVERPSIGHPQLGEWVELSTEAEAAQAVTGRFFEALSTVAKGQA